MGVPQLDLNNTKAPNRLSTSDFSKKADNKMISFKDVIQVEDVEEKALASERRDMVPSLRESHFEIQKPAPELKQLDVIKKEPVSRPQTSCDLGRFSPLVMIAEEKKQLSNKCEENGLSRQRSRQFKGPTSKTLGARKETEAEFTERLYDERPRGVKGLAYIVQEIRRGIAEGILVPDQDKLKGTVIGKLQKQVQEKTNHHGKMMKKFEMLVEVIKDKHNAILDHLIKEQNFSNDESIIQKNEQHLEKIVEGQQMQMQEFENRLNGWMKDLHSEIDSIRDVVSNIESFSRRNSIRSMKSGGRSHKHRHSESPLGKSRHGQSMN